MKLSVIYEDNHLIVVKKPINIPVQEDESGDMDLLRLLKSYVKEKYSKPGNVYMGLVHRLDRPVGGLMVFARTSKAASRLSDQIRQNQFIKKYIAVLDGELYNIEDKTLIHYISKDDRINKVSIQDTEVPNSKRAELRFSTIAVRDGKTLVSIGLNTGRKHQIRAQFSKFGYPLVGDVKYGRGNGKVSIALHAYAIGFVHPTLKEKMYFTASPNASDYPWNCFKGEIDELFKEDCK